MTIKFTNNAVATLATGISATDVALTVLAGKGDLFPAVSGGTDYFTFTLIDASGNKEIVYCYARTAGSDILSSLVRAREGTVARVFAGSTSVVSHRLTAATLAAIQTTANGALQTTGGTLTGAVNENVGGAITITAGVADLNSINANTVSITGAGNQTITSFGVAGTNIVSSGASREVYVSAQCVIANCANYSGVPGGTLQLQIGDNFKITFAETTWNIYGFKPAGGVLQLTGGNLAGAINEVMASMTVAATMDIGAAAGNTIYVTGAGTVSSFPVAGYQSGTRRTISCGSSFTIQGGAPANTIGNVAVTSIVTAAGDWYEYVLSAGAAQWQLANYSRTKSFGVGQVWTDVTASRSAGTDYQNITGESITISVKGAVGNGLTIYVGDSTATEIAVASVYSTNIPMSVTVIVPTNHYYRAFGAVSSWVELR